MSPLDTASSLLWWSNVLYVVGAVLTLGTSAVVLFEKRQAGKGIEVRHSVRNEVFFVTSALICLAGTCGAIYFSNKVSHIKDADLAAYKVSAGLQIAHAQDDAADALENSFKLAVQLRNEQLERTSGQQFLQVGQTALQQRVQGVTDEIAPRHFHASESDIGKIAPFRSGDRERMVDIGFECNAADVEACGLVSDFESFVDSAALRHFHLTTMGPPPQSPLLVSGVHIRFSNTEIAKNLAAALGPILHARSVEPAPSTLDSKMDFFKAQSMNGCGDNCVLVIVGPKN